MPLQPLHEAAGLGVEDSHQVIVADRGQALSGRVERHARDDRRLLLALRRRQFDDPVGRNFGYVSALAGVRLSMPANASIPNTSEKGDFNVLTIYSPPKMEGPIAHVHAAPVRTRSPSSHRPKRTASLREVVGKMTKG